MLVLNLFYCVTLWGGGGVAILYVTMALSALKVVWRRPLTFVHTVCFIGNKAGKVRL